MSTLTCTMPYRVLTAEPVSDRGAVAGVGTEVGVTGAAGIFVADGFGDGRVVVGRVVVGREVGAGFVAPVPPDPSWVVAPLAGSDGVGEGVTVLLPASFLPTGAAGSID